MVFNIYIKRLLIRHCLLGIGLVLSFWSLSLSVFAQNGYIYIHKNATDEDSSPDFPFSVTGPNSFSGSYSLNDQHPTNLVRDLGATSSGGLYAIAGNTLSGSGYPVYYRAANTSVWTQLASAQATRIDGGPGNTHIHANNSGQVYYYDGASFVNLNSTNAADVAFDRSGTNRMFYVNGSGNVFYLNGPSGSWTQASGLTAKSIDVAPNGRLVSIATNGTIYISDYNGANQVSLGTPGGDDIAVADDGTIYIVTGGAVSRYTGGYAAGGSWVREETSRLAARITGGVNGQMWAILYSSQNNIWSRTAGGFWIDDESVRTPGNGNSVLIPVTPGTYSVNEGTTSGWDLGAVDVYDPTSNSTANVVSGTTSVNVAAGEVVHLVYRNFKITSFAVVNTCSGTPYLETFGTGSNTTLGDPLTGQTNYHYIGTNGTFMNDGYYMVASNSSQAGAGTNSYGSFNDHTSGNGTGRMMLINAAYDKGEFFRRRFTGLLPGTQYSFSAWIMNLNNAGIKPNVKFEIINPATQTVLSTLSTGNITNVGQWTQYQLQFTASQSDVDLVLRNNNIGGTGNDLALDDIRFGLAQPNQPVVTVSNATCTANGSIEVNSPLGQSIEYSIDGSIYQSSPIFSNVPAGNYSVTARYVNSVGCTSTPASVIVNPATAPAVGAINGPTSVCSNAASTYTYTSSTAGGVWSVSPTTLASIDASTGVLTTVAGANGTATITYTVTNGSCQSQATLAVEVSSSGCTPTPVSLTKFQAQAQSNRSVLVTWQTAQERNNKAFVVERSKDLLTFEPIAQVTDVAGTTTSISNYRFVDTNPYHGTSYYRLTQQDMDGKTESFKAVSVIIDATYRLYPNPMTSPFITLELDEPITAEIKLYEVSGREVAFSRGILSSQSIKIQPSQKLNPGVYLLLVRERATTRSYKVIVP